MKGFSWLVVLGGLAFRIDSGGIGRRFGFRASGLRRLDVRVDGRSTGSEPQVNGCCGC